MKVILIKFEWIYREDGKAEKIQKRIDLLASLGIRLSDNQKDDGYAQFEVLATESQVAELLIAGESFEAVRHIDLHKGAGATVDAFEAISKKLEAMQGGGDQFNAACHVHMPGNALMTFNATMLLEDSCTDALQLQMDAGWRIIAACPQPDQRRPDYILGRFDPVHAPESGGAQRGAA